jgi:hypothetical protein
MRKFAAVALLVFAFAAMTLYAGEWTGYISDAGCAAKKGEDPNHAGCAKSCIGRGANAVFVSQGKVYTLDKQDEAKKFAGDKVVLKGTASDDGTAIKVESIKKAE